MTAVMAFYVDESGSFSIHDRSQPWVVLLAVGFDDAHWATIEHAMNGLKRTYFPLREPHEVEVRSNDLRMAAVRPHLRNIFAQLSRNALRGFGNDLYAAIDALPFSWCAVVVHKPSAARDRGLTDAQSLFEFAYRALLERLDRWCAEVRTPGRLFLDQRDGDLYGPTHRCIVRFHETRRVEMLHPLRVVERPYFHDSSRSNHIQLADIVAYNVLRRYRSEDPAYPYFVRIASKLSHFGPARESGMVVYGSV